MSVLYDDDDPPPQVGYSDLHWWLLNRWAEQCMRWARMWGFLVLLIVPLAAHELPNVSLENQAWYQTAQTNPDSYPRKVRGWFLCCKHAEVVDAKYIIYPDGKDGWRWNDNGTIKDIPNEIIHWSEGAPDNKPTLFVYQEIMTCFYPPQGGV